MAATPTEVRGEYQLWVRVDSAGYRADVVHAGEPGRVVLKAQLMDLGLRRPAWRLGDTTQVDGAEALAD